jgi:hypothetical protein
MEVRSVEHPHLLLWTKGSGKCIVIWASVNQDGPTSDYYYYYYFNFLMLCHWLWHPKRGFSIKLATGF